MRTRAIRVCTKALFVSIQIAGKKVFVVFGLYEYQNNFNIRSIQYSVFVYEYANNYLSSRIKNIFALAYPAPLLWEVFLMAGFFSEYCFFPYNSYISG